MSIDTSHMTPMMQQYWSIKNQYPDCLLFYRMGDFYELFFDDALQAAKLLDITLTKRGQHLGDDIPMCGVPFHAATSYLHKIIKLGYKVAICEQMENPKEAKKRGAKAVVKRDVIRIITQGTLLEDALLEGHSHNYLCALSRKGHAISLAYTDISTGHVWVINSTVQELESSLNRINPKEILLASNLLHDDGINYALRDYYKCLQALPSSQFTLKPCKQHLLNFYGVTTLETFGDFTDLDIIALGRVIDYINVTQKNSMPSLRPPKKEYMHMMMDIDNVALRALEIVDGQYGNASLFKAINNTQTPMGARLLRQRLVKPLLDIALINKRYDDIDFFMCHEKLRHELYALCASMPDMPRALGRLSADKSGPRDMKLIKDAIQYMRIIVTMWQHYTRQYPEVTLSLLDNIDNVINKVRSLYDTLDQALQDELPLLARDGDFVKVGYDAQLDKALEYKHETKRVIDTLSQEYQQATTIDNLKIKFNNLVGYYIEVPTSKIDKVTDDFIHKQTLKNGIRYTTGKLNDIAHDISESADKIHMIEMNIYTYLHSQIIEHVDILHECADMVANLDIAISMGMLAQDYNYTRPILRHDTSWHVEKGRHPFVELSLKNSKSKFTANDCTMDDSARLLILTGPNMAGKSTFLRQNAIIAIMAQAGLFVPASSCIIGVVDKIFARVGAQDNLAQGQSTFMVEMVETASILHKATSNSFIIMDEVGRGTSTQDGLSLAWSIAEYLQHIGCRTIFATHYHELTQLATPESTIRNIAMKVSEWEKDIIFHHEVIAGAAAASYGIYVAKIAGIPNKVIKRAHNMMQHLTLNHPYDSTQLSLFDSTIAQEPAKDYLYNDSEEAVIEDIRQLDVNSLSPRDAFDLINIWYDKLR